MRNKLRVRGARETNKQKQLSLSNKREKGRKGGEEKRNEKMAKKNYRRNQKYK